MRRGKISESILKRSVLRPLKNFEGEVLKGAGVGNDCAFLSWDNSGFHGQEAGSVIAMTTQTVTLPVKNAAYLAVMAVANNLAAAGAEPVGVTLSLTLPEETEELLLKEMMEQAKVCCEELGMQIVGGHTEISGTVHIPVITASAVGKPLWGIGQPGAGQDKSDGVLPGDAKSKGARKDPGRKSEEKKDSLDIVMSKWIGLEGTSVIAHEKEKELAGRFPMRMILKAQSQEEYLSVAPEAAIALKSGVYAMHDVRSGGVFGALWELSQKMGVGLCIDLKKIPVRQETIEICEFYRLNPYELLSGGALLMAAAHGTELVETLKEKGIPAFLIGRTKAGNDKTILNQDETRYLEPPGPDEILKIF